MVRRLQRLAVAAILLAGAACGSDDGDASPDPTDGTGAVTSPGNDAGGGDEDDGEGGGVGDGCDIVTEADGEELLGEPVVLQSEDGINATMLLASCSWGVDTEFSFKLLQFYVYDGAQFFGGEAFADEEGFERIDGLGDDAFFLPGMGLQLQVLDGDRSIMLDASGFNVDDPDFTEDRIRAGLLDLAEDVLDRM